MQLSSNFLDFALITISIIVNISLHCMSLKRFLKLQGTIFDSI